VVWLKSIERKSNVHVQPRPPHNAQVTVDCIFFVLGREKGDQEGIFGEVLKRNLTVNNIVEIFVYIQHK